MTGESHELRVSADTLPPGWVLSFNFRGRWPGFPFNCQHGDLSHLLSWPVKNHLRVCDPVLTLAQNDSVFSLGSARSVRVLWPRRATDCLPDTELRQNR